MDRRALTAAGLGFLAATLGSTGDSAHAEYGGVELSLYVGLATVAGLGLVALRSAGGLALAVAAGLLWAGSDVTIKALSGKTGELGAGVLVHPFALVILVLSLVGLLVSARSLQIGPAVPVIALTSTTANALTTGRGRSCSASRCRRSRSRSRCGSPLSRSSSGPRR